MASSRRVASLCGEIYGDNLWKGKRNTELENKVITNAAAMCQQDYWNIFVNLDSGFEEVAAGNPCRIIRNLVEERLSNFPTTPQKT